MFKSWRFWLGIVISLVCLYFAFQGIQFDKLFDALKGIDYLWLVLASVLFLVSYSGRVFRWRLLFSPLVLRLGKIFNALNIGYFLSNLLPARLGDVVRAYLIGEIEGVSKMRAISTIVVERMSDGLTVVLLLAVTALFVRTIPEIARQGMMLTAALGIIAISILLWLSFHKERGMKFLRRLTQPITFLQNPKLWSAFESLIDGFAVLRSPKPIAGVALWSLFAWIVGGVMYWIVIRAVGLDAEPSLRDVGQQFAAAFMVMTVTSLAVVVPSSPGYVGVFHAACVITLTTVWGVNKDIALTYAIIMHAFTYLWLIALGIFSMWHEGLSFSQLQSIEIQAAEN